MRKFLKTLRNQKKPLIIFTDFDGCLTDDRVWLNAAGEEFVAALDSKEIKREIFTWSS